MIIFIKQNKYLLLIGMLLSTFAARAGNGDTVVVRTFDNYHMNTYGNHFKKALAPPVSQKSQRIWMKYTVGCTANGQCEWDYTVKLMLREHTGKKDSTLKQAPSFKVINGAAKDTIVRCSYDTTYLSRFDTVSKQSDSVLANPIRIAMFGDTLNPLVCTDTLVVWPANFYRYAYDSNGVKTDSFFVAAQDTLQVTYTPYYNVFEVLKDWEMGRMITPYAKTFPKSFRYDYWFDVTDFATLLHDSIEIRLIYEGYSFGFTSTLDFYFIEGTPAREAYKLDQLYNAYYTYGNVNNPIENNLNAKIFTVPADAAATKLRIIITGHGGESNENCAEFCAKNYYLYLNKKQIATQLVWKDDCGSNAIFNQPGTWIYDRSNWCPGEKIRVFEYTLDVAPGSTDTLDMNMDPFVANGGAGYGIAAYLVYYKPVQRTLDAGIEEIIAPTNNFWHSRKNPVCDNGQIVLRNWGSQQLTQAKFSYQIGNAAISTWEWSGSLNFEQSAEVRLPYLNWPADNTQNTFKVWLTEVNGQAISSDENSHNNMLTSKTDIPPVVPAFFIIETLTNTKPGDNRYVIRDAYKNIIFTKTFTAASTMHRDTFHLGLGCYTFEMTDAGEDGLSFWANSDGNGTVRIRSGVTPVNFIKTFNPDFGDFIQYHFTVQYKVGIDEQLSNLQNITIYPSPADESIRLEGAANITRIELLDLHGRVILQQNDWNNALDVRAVTAGFYLVRITDNLQQTRVQKITIQH
ncbi:MAG: peptide-N-glycosidase F-related protein [Bacteroidia bacterium]